MRTRPLPFRGTTLRGTTLRGTALRGALLRGAAVLATAAVTVGSLAGCGGEPFRPERDLGVASPTIASPPPTQSTRPTSGPSATPTTGSPTATTSTGPSLPSLPTAQERPSASTASPASPTPGSTATAPAPAPGPTSTSPRPGTAAPTATPAPTSTPRPTATRTTRPTGEPSRPSSPTRTQRPPSPTSTTARPTTPPPTTPPPTTSSPTSSTPPAAPAYLDELGGPGSGPVTMGGTTYGHSISASACTIFSKQPTYAWSLDGRYSRLTGVVGQDDGSESREAVLRLVVRGDGRTLASRTVRYGQTSSLGVSVAGVQRLTVSFTEVECAPGEGAALVLGSGKVG